MGWFSRQKDVGPSRPPVGNAAVAVRLEDVCVGVEQAAAAYVAAPSKPGLSALRTACTQLDQQTQAGDTFTTYENTVSPRYGRDPGVVGETSFHPMAERVPSDEFAAQVMMVRSAKQVLADPGPDTVADLQARLSALAATRNPGGAATS